VSDLTVYEKRTCTTCRKLSALLEQRGVEAEKVDYFVEPLDEPRLRELLRKAGLRPGDVLRTNEDVYHELRLADREPEDDELITLLVEHPELLQRPIVERGERAVLARPPERVLELLA